MGLGEVSSTAPGGRGVRGVDHLNITMAGWPIQNTSVEGKLSFMENPADRPLNEHYSMVEKLGR